MIGVNLWMEKLDKRYKQTLQVKAAANLALSVHPHGTPNWAIVSLWHDGSIWTVILCFIELYNVENGCANGIQKDNKDDDESKAFFAMLLNIMYYFASSGKIHTW